LLPIGARANCCRGVAVACRCPFPLSLSPSPCLSASFHHGLLLLFLSFLLSFSLSLFLSFSPSLFLSGCLTCRFTVGPGTYTYLNNTVYTGQFVKGKMQGKGTFTFPGDAVYDNDEYLAPGLSIPEKLRIPVRCPPRPPSARGAAEAPALPWGHVASVSGSQRQAWGGHARVERLVGTQRRLVGRDPPHVRGRGEETHPARERGGERVERRACPLGR